MAKKSAAAKSKKTPKKIAEKAKKPKPATVKKAKSLQGQKSKSARGKVQKSAGSPNKSKQRSGNPRTAGAGRFFMVGAPRFSLSPMYPISFMYQSGGLFYYAANCCVDGHPGVIITDFQIPRNKLGCPQPNGGGNGDAAAVDYSADYLNSVPNSGSTPKFSRGIAVDVGKKLKLCDSAAFKIENEQVRVSTPAGMQNPQQLTDEYGNSLANGTCFMIMNIHVPSLSSEFFRIAHPVADCGNGNGAAAITSSIQLSQVSQKVPEVPTGLPFGRAATMAGAKTEDRHIEILILMPG